MTRAEKQVLEVYPVMSLTNDTNAPKRKYFTDGYALAQQDYIEKACEWIAKNYINYAHNTLGKEALAQDFRNAMKRE